MDPYRLSLCLLFCKYLLMKYVPILSISRIVLPSLASSMTAFSFSFLLNSTNIVLNITIHLKPDFVDSLIFSVLQIPVIHIRYTNCYTNI